MDFWDFPRSAAGALVLLESARRRNLQPRDALKGTGLTHSQLREPGFEVAAGQELSVIQNIIDAFGKPTRLGLEMGMDFHFSTYGIWGLGVVSSVTGVESNAMAFNFLPLTFAFTLITYHEEGGNALLTFGEPDFPSDLRDFVLARDMAAAAILTREINGSEFRLSKVTMRTPGSALAEGPPVVLFGAEVQSDAPSNQIVFDRTILDRPLPQANAATAAMCEQMCRDLITRRCSNQRSGNLVRRYMNIGPEKTPATVRDFARLANTSERTLKRRLRAEGTSFRQLSASSRRTAAEKLLQNENLTLTGIAERLGFSDLSSFSQAFKRWSGLAPSHYRREWLNQAASDKTIEDELRRDASD